MPLTMPRSTAQMTGCSIGGVAERAVLGDDAQLAVAVASAWAAKPWAVRASATAWRAARKERWPSATSPIAAAIARPYSAPTSSAMAVACSVGQEGERPAEQGDEQVVVADRDVEVDPVGADPVALRRPPGPGAAPGRR